MRQCFTKEFLPLRGGLVEVAVANVVDSHFHCVYFGRLRDGLPDWGRLIKGTVLTLMIEVLASFSPGLATELNRDGSGLGGGECNVLPECHEEGVNKYPHGESYKGHED
jgi:hypothetical protein